MAAGVKGVVAKWLDDAYVPSMRAWVKARTRLTAEAVVGGVLGSLEQPDALILGRAGLCRLLVIVAAAVTVVQSGASTATVNESRVTGGYIRDCPAELTCRYQHTDCRNRFFELVRVGELCDCKAYVQEGPQDTPSDHQ
ncbi:hypothetical protein GCM10023320_77810 [Pseudonocardia adelaidensis]|uniref:Uncharacterized protein n=1 Tax=Pseudonocardia adelaidensis TaxID=648754 RepID=A0ABP9P4V2_9PSEU